MERIDQGGEKAVTPGAGRIFDRQRAWTLLFNTSQWIDFNSYYEKNDDVVAYAYVILYAEEEMKVKFGLSHNDGLKSTWHRSCLIRCLCL